MRINLQTKFFFVFAMLTIISLGNFGFLWFAEKKSAEQQVLVTHTYKVLAQSEVFLGHLKDTETGQRGFLLTGQAKYLEPYLAGIESAQADFIILVNLTRDNAIQQSRLVSIRRKMAEKFSELNKTIELVQKGTPAEALNIVNSGVGKQIMDSIRLHLRQFKAEEEHLLEIRENSFRAEQVKMRMIFVGEALLLVFLIILVAFAIRRNVINPVIGLTNNTARLAAGKKLEEIKPANVAGEDEMTLLIDGFNNMATTISTTMSNLASAQKDAEEKKHRLSDIIWSTNIGTWEWNIETDEIQFNERWADIIGYSLSELEPVNADTWRNNVHPDDLEKSYAQLEKHYCGELEYYECETRRLHKDGTYIWVQDRGKVVEWSEDGKPVRMSGTNIDISERKEIERAKSEFISTVSHELRTPLTSIKGSLGLIKSGTLGNLPDKLQSMLDIAYNNSDRLVLLINDILDMDKIEAGKMNFNLKTVEVRSLVDEAIEANKGYGDEHGVTFLRSGLEEQALIEGDKDRLMQVLSNLMSNAAKFSPDGEIVTLSIFDFNEEIRIAVEDKGPGIPEDFRDSLFEKFSQADSSDTRKVGGTGLGLSISQAIVEQHRGTIGFDTETGNGSTFYINLPKLADRSETRPVQTTGNGNRILICEDEADVAAILETMLHEAGYQTGIARTAAQARNMLEEIHFDAMTLDLGLPDQDGISLMQELRKNPKTHDLPIIVVSATANERKQELNGDAIDVIDWIEKPIDPTFLLNRLGKTLKNLANTRPRILHVEDDDSVLEIVESLVNDMGSVTKAKTLKEARNLLETDRFDLVLLDLMLPDGKGETLLPLLHKPDQPSIPVVVFSAKDVTRETVERIDVALVKSKTSNEELLGVIQSIIENRQRTG